MKRFQAWIGLSDGRKIIWGHLTQSQAANMYHLLVTATRLEGFDGTDVINVEWGVMP